jgi:hypothetical protein
VAIRQIARNSQKRPKEVKQVFMGGKIANIFSHRELAEKTGAKGPVNNLRTNGE